MFESVVEIRGLTKRYPGARHSGGVTAVDHIDLTINRGEIYGFLGPNGAGKTTTLRMLVGLISPTSGAISVFGHKPGSREALARVGALIEGPAFYPYLSGRDNLRVVARYAGTGADAIEETLELVDLAGRGDDRFASYSLGMKQRLGVAAALLKDPELIVLDEPTNGLDPAGMRDMRALIKELGAQGRTVILSSHMLGEVQQICDRVGVIDHGTMITEGTVDELRGGVELVIAASPIDTATATLRGMDGVRIIGAADGRLRIDADERHTAAINRNLVSAGVAVTEIRRVERELEDVFFAVTAEPHVTGITHSGSTNSGGELNHV